MSSKLFLSVATISVFSFASYVWFCYAWTFEDIFITYRVIDNFIHGFGLRWNVVERVQVVTHPLWMFLLMPVYYFSREIVLSTAVVSAICTMMAMVTLYRGKIYQSTAAALLAILILFLTKTFPTYSSSGFENPLSHLIACAFFIAVFRNGITTPSYKAPLLAALGILTRIDTLLLYGPYLIAQIVFQRGQWKRTAVGMMPLIVWGLFSFVYYGTLVPNTALAKIPDGIEQAVILRQGAAYISDLFEKDLLAAVVILLAVWSFVVALCEGGSERYTSRFHEPLLLLNAGAVAYCIYIVWIGGDYLSYRFWSLPLLYSVILGVLRFERLCKQGAKQLTPHAVLVAFTMLAGVSLWLETADGSQTTSIGDDRLKDFFAPLRLSDYINHGWSLDHPWRSKGLQLRTKAEDANSSSADKLSVEPNVGIIGYYAGPQVHIMEPFALTEPLLARLPTEGEWRIGHFPRRAPQGYVTWLLSGDGDRLPSPLKGYLEKLTIVVRAPVFDSKRLRELLLFSTGAYDGLLRTYVWQRGGVRLRSVPLSKLSEPVPAGTAREDWRLIGLLPGEAMDVIVDTVVKKSFVEISIDCGDLYELDFETGDGERSSTTVSSGSCSGIRIVKIPIPEQVRGRRLKRITIKPLPGGTAYKLGHLLFVD
jgi:arabinofuranosyltransferase